MLQKNVFYQVGMIALIQLFQFSLITDHSGVDSILSTLYAFSNYLNVKIYDIGLLCMLWNSFFVIHCHNTLGMNGLFPLLCRDYCYR